MSGEMIAQAMRAALKETLQDDPFLKETSAEFWESLCSEWEEMGANWTPEEFIDSWTQPFVGYAGLRAYKSCFDVPPETQTVSPEDLDDPNVLIGNHVIDGNLDLEEAGAVLVLGNLEVQGSIRGDEADRPLMVTGNLVCRGLLAEGYVIAYGDLDAGPLFYIQGNSGPILVGGTVTARSVLGPEAALRLWNPKSQIVSDDVDLTSAYLTESDIQSRLS